MRHPYFSLSQLFNFLRAEAGPHRPVCGHQPTSVCLFMTGKCNLKCEWCYRNTNESLTTTGNMSLAAAGKILAVFPKATHLILAGFGEPLLAPDVFKIASVFSARPMRVSLISNGLLLYDRAKELLSSGVRSISISLNAPDAASYVKVCGAQPSDFDRVLAGVREIVKHERRKRPILRISSVVSRENIARTEELIRLAEDLGVDSLDLHSLIVYSQAADSSQLLAASEQSVLQQLELLKKKKYGISINWPEPVAKLSRPSSACSELWSWIGVDAEGNTAGCQKAMGPSPVYGNIFTDGGEVWNNKYRTDMRNAFLKREFLCDCCKICSEVQP